MSPAIQSEISRTNRTFEEAVAAHTTAPLDAVYTVNARILPPGAEMISGRENIKAFWKSATDGLNVRSVKLETVEFELLGDAGHEIGRATLNFNSDAPAMHVKYVVIWKREDGAWKWDVDIWNPNA